jgi:predicted transcriptional regulator
MQTCPKCSHIFIEMNNLKKELVRMLADSAFALSIRELEEMTGRPSGHIVPILNELESIGVVSQINGKYACPSFIGYGSHD